MTLTDKVIAARKYKGMSRAVTCELLNITLKQLLDIEFMAFRGRNSFPFRHSDPDMAKDREDVSRAELA